MKEMFIENAIYGYKDNRLSDGRFNRHQFVYMDGQFYSLDASHSYIEGTFDIEEEDRLVLIKE